MPRDVFLHLFVVFTLYWLAVSFITLCWQYINYFFPDALVLRYDHQSYVWPIRFSVASLIIVLPLFILASWYLNRIYQREKVVRESKIRKWLIYLTLFIASLIIIGDLVTLIYNFLGGEVTVKFILKALSVLIVAGAVFGYYLDDVKRSEPSRLGKYFASVVSLAVLTAVVGAFFIVGSPIKARLFQLDQQRISDLQSIQWQIVNYWQRKEQLPQQLSDLQDPISGYVVPTDPKDQKPYGYNLKNSNTLTFELCATFDLDGEAQYGLKPRAVYPVYDDGTPQNWGHSAGYVCFERQIDRQLYPPLEKRK